MVGGASAVLVSGGGANNPTLLAMLANELRPLHLSIRTSDEFGLPSEAKEAAAFALMAFETWNRRPSNVPSGILEETARKISRSDIESAIDAIAGARRGLIAGTDQMAFFASYLRHLLMLLDLQADIVASPSQEALSRLGRIDDSMLVIGLSAGRPHPLVVRAMKLARNRRAATIAIATAQPPTRFVAAFAVSAASTGPPHGTKTSPSVECTVTSSGRMHSESQ